MSTIMTVAGAIDPADFGRALVHEHVIVDFGGAATASPDRYDRDEVIRTMRPYLDEVTALGFTGFVDCTPAYLARDPRILSGLARLTGLHIVTNTGQYKEPFLPDSTFRITPEELAAEWIAEWTDGIDGTKVRPGFIKTAVEPESLAPTQQKVIEAAAIASRETGLTIGTHTCAALPALEILRILDRHGVSPGKWIFIHAHVESDAEMLRVVAKEGCWIELDGIGAADDVSTLFQLLKLLDWGFADRILLSHDAGWYTVGEPGGGKPRPYTHLSTVFLPLAERAGVDGALVDKLLVENPAKAFAIG